MAIKSFSIVMMWLSIGSIAMAQKKTPVDLEILPDNSSAIITYKSGVSHLISLPDLTVIRKFAPAVPEDRAYLAEISPDGKRLVVFYDKSKKIVVWNIETGSVLLEVPVDVSTNFYGSIYEFDHTRNQLICKVSAKGNSAHEFNVYDLTDGKLIGPMQKLNNKFPVRNIFLSPDGNSLLGYSGTGLDNGELEVFDYTSGEQICEKWMGEDSEITFAEFISTDTIEVWFRYHLDAATEIVKFSIFEKGKEIKGSRVVKDNGGLYFDVHTNRFVIEENVHLSGSYYTPEVHAYSESQGWFLAVARKSDQLAIYDTRKTTDKELNGKKWKEPTQMKSVTLP